MIPKTWSTTDKIFSHPGPFFSPFTPLPPKEFFEKIPRDNIILHKCTINNNHMIIWFLRYQLQQTNFFAILGHFWHLFLSNSPKNENIKKMKKTPRDIIILHDCTNNYDYRVYCSQGFQLSF